MKTTLDNQADLGQAILILGSISFLVGAATGATLGAFVVGPWIMGAFPDVLPAFVGSYPRALFGALGVVVGGGGSAVSTYQALRTQARRRARAASLGLSTASQPRVDADALEDDVSRLFGADTFPHVHPIAHRDTSFGTLTIVDVERTTGGVSSSAEHTSQGERIRETVAHVALDDLELPRFRLQPVGRVGKWLGKTFGGDQSAALEDAKLSKRYHLSADDLERARPLLSQEVKGTLRANPHWDLRSTLSCLVLSHPREVASAEGLEHFIAEAEVLADQVLRAASRIPVRPKPQEPEGEPAVRDPVRDPVSDPVLDAFLEEPAPRRVPASIRRRAMSSSLMLPMIVGMIFLVGGTMFCILSRGDMTKEADRASMTALGALMATVGAILAGVTVYYRHNRMRLLTHGRLTTGTVERVVRTGMRVDNKQRYLATIRFSAEGTVRVATCSLYGPAVEVAEALVEDGRPTRILYHRRNHAKFLWEGVL